MTTVKWRKFRKYSGPFAKAPLAKIDIPTRFADHWERAFWLTSMVESGGRPGLINMYDGCGATCGLHQAIAVYPRNMDNDVQGPLWRLLWLLDSVVPLSYYPLWDRLIEVGWRLTGDGLVMEDTGERVTSKTIRNVLTPLNGRVPETGERWEKSRAWAEAFSEIFALKQGLRVQTHLGTEHMQRSAKRVKIKVGQYRKTIEEWCYKGNALSDQPLPTDKRVGVDLAMSLFWCHFINGPRPAKESLQTTLELTSGPVLQPVKFAKALIQALGNNSYGRWDDDIEGGRYTRARLHAMKVWPRELFENNGIMPKDLPD